MTTEHQTSSLRPGSRAGAALLVTGLLAFAAAAPTVRPAVASGTHVSIGSVRVVSTTISRKARTWSYGWPVRPFDRQHPVRAFLDDPRIGAHGGTSFHFGIDISAPDGTAVYAVAAGTAYLDTPRAVSVADRESGHVFGYWHIVPAIRHAQHVCAHQLLGHIAKGWGHVHFAEKLGGVRVNPLRDGGLGPYADHTAPSVRTVTVDRNGLSAVVFDTPDPRVPGGWADEPVTPALLRWRVAGGTWHTAADSRRVKLPNSRFDDVYTPATRQNHEGRPGRFSFYLDRSWRAGDVCGLTIEIEALDTAGNCTVASVQFAGRSAS